MPPEAVNGHVVSPIGWDTMGDEWAQSCTCGWWARSGKDGTRAGVVAHASAHRRAAELGEAGLSAETAAIVNGEGAEGVHLRLDTLEATANA